MHLTRATKYAVRISLTQGTAASSAAAQSRDRLVLPFACLLAAFGVGLSSFSLKQLQASRARRGF